MQALARPHARWLLVLAVLALVAVACDGGTGDTDGTDDPAEETDGGEFSMASCEPQNLLPPNSTEVCGAQILSFLFTGLVEYDPDTGEVAEGEGVAESIESEDQTTWTITIKDDYTFHDGEPVTAESFVNAWNWMADPENEQAGIDFLDTAGFVGLEDVVAGDADELSGVTVVDDTIIEVELAAPFSPFPEMMGYTAFYPLPESFYEDPGTFEDAPVGNGPYMMDGEWERGQQVALQRYEDYAGTPGNAERVEIRIYAEEATAYRDLQAGNLDILAGVMRVPPEQIEAAETEFGEDFFTSETSSFSYLGFPLYDEQWQDPNLRKAISLAIDRQAIIDAIYAGSYDPAGAVISPVLVEAHRPAACDVCEHDPERAQELYAQTDGVEEPLQLWFNSGAGHEEWIQAVANQLRDTLGITDVEFQSLEFADYLGALEGGTIDGPFRLGWSLSYLSPQYALQLYVSDADSNYMGYASEEFDRLYREGSAADTPEEARDLFQQAEDVLLEDLPIIPMWYQIAHNAHSDRVSNVIVDARTFVRVPRVEVTD